MSKVDQLEYLHCNSVVMWPEYHKIKPIKINWMEGVREKSIPSASRYVCARRVWNVWMLVTWPTTQTLIIPQNSYSDCVMCKCDAVMSVMWLLTRRDVWRVWQWAGAEFLHIGKPSWAINNVSVTSPSCGILNFSKKKLGNTSIQPPPWEMWNMVLYHQQLATEAATSLLHFGPFCEGQMTKTSES